MVEKQTSHINDKYGKGIAAKLNVPQGKVQITEYNFNKKAYFIIIKFQ